MSEATVIPVQRRAYTVVSHLLAAIVLPWLGAIVGAVSGSAALGVAAGVAILMGVGWSAARKWNNRVEFHADHLVHWDAGRSRLLSFDELSRVDVRWFDPRQAFASDQEMTATFVPTQGAPVQIRGTWGALQGAVGAVGDVLATRMVGRLRAGETLVFADRPGFPMRAVLAFLFFALIAAAVVVLAVAGSGSGSYRGVPQMAGMLLMTGIFMVRSLKTWLAARRHGGLAVSSQGVSPLTGYRPSEVAVGGYRTAPGAAAGWIPWGALGSIREDGFSLSFTTSTSDRPVVLSPDTEGYVALGRLLRRESAREQSFGAPSGVRIDVGAEAPAGDEAEAIAGGAGAANRQGR